MSKIVAGPKPALASSVNTLISWLANYDASAMRHSLEVAPAFLPSLEVRRPGRNHGKLNPECTRVFRRSRVQVRRRLGAALGAPASPTAPERSRGALKPEPPGQRWGVVRSWNCAPVPGKRSDSANFE